MPDGLKEFEAVWAHLEGRELVMKPPWYHRILYHLLSDKQWTKYCARLAEKQARPRSARNGGMDDARRKMQALANETESERIEKLAAEAIRIQERENLKIEREAKIRKQLEEEDRKRNREYQASDARTRAEEDLIRFLVEHPEGSKRPHKSPCSCVPCSGWVLAKRARTQVVQERQELPFDVYESEVGRREHYLSPIRPWELPQDKKNMVLVRYGDMAKWVLAYQTIDDLFSDKEINAWFGSAYIEPWLASYRAGDGYHQVNGNYQLQPGDIIVFAAPHNQPRGTNSTGPR